MPEEVESPLVLIVDDHIPAAEMLSRLFDSRGYRSEMAHDGMEAIRKAQLLRPDLILLDIMMPVMDGFQVMERLRAMPETMHIPTIFITAKDDASDIEHGLQLGADDYIPKPVKPRELMARAQSKIEARKLRNALEEKTRDLETLLRFSEALNNHLNVAEILQLVLYLILDLIPAQAAIIYRLDDKANILEIRTESKDQDLDIDDLALFERVKNEPHAVKWTSSSHPQISNANAGMALNLAHGEQIHAVLVLLNAEAFQPQALRIFEGAGGQITLALRNAELYAMQVHYAEHLEEMVHERTEALRSAQELLIRSEKLASIGQLAAGIAHEINNPLLPIRVNLEMMKEDVEAGADVSLEDIDQSLHSVKRISRIVEQLQQFTRKRSDDLPDLQELVISDVLEDVLALSRTYIRHSGIQVLTNLQGRGKVFGNRDQLEQVFLNLILNAQAAMEKGGKLAIESYVEGEALILRFADTGHGIPENMRQKIFDPFVSTKPNGSGLGLFISHQIIQNHSGSIQVESEVGKGATFTLNLPIVPNQ